MAFKKVLEVQKNELCGNKVEKNKRYIYLLSKYFEHSFY